MSEISEVPQPLGEPKPTPKIKERFVYKSEISDKFWEPKVEGSTFTAHFGKTNTKGQLSIKDFPDPETANKNKRKAIVEKLAKGYKPTPDTIVSLLEDTPPVESPEALATLYVGEHVEEAATDLCGWLTACLQYQMTPGQFERVWEKFIDGEDEELSIGLGRYWSEQEGSEVYWHDILEEIFEVPELYKEALEKGADRFVYFNNNAYVDVVAVKGDPGANIIERFVATAPGLYAEDRSALLSLNDFQWPQELGPGAPIVGVHIGAGWGSAKLRDGREIEVQG